MVGRTVPEAASFRRIAARVDRAGRTALNQLAAFFSHPAFFFAGLSILAVLILIPESVFTGQPAGSPPMPWDVHSGLPVLCPFRLVTGHPCPGCGVVHGVAALVHGDPARAFMLHPFGLILGIMSGMCFPLRVATRRMGRNPWFDAPRGTGLVFAAFCAAWLAWWVFRLTAGPG